MQLTNSILRNFSTHTGIQKGQNIDEIIQRNMIIDPTVEDKKTNPHHVEYEIPSSGVNRTLYGQLVMDEFHLQGYPAATEANLEYH